MLLTSPCPMYCKRQGLDLGSWHWNRTGVVAMGGSHLALVVTIQSDTCIPGHKGRLLTNSS